jgi:hypothetical protein
MSAADPQVERLFSEQPHRIGREDQEAAIQNRPTEWAQTDDAGDLATCVVGVTFNHQPQNPRTLSQPEFAPELPRYGWLALNQHHPSSP